MRLKADMTTVKQDMVTIKDAVFRLVERSNGGGD